MTTPLYEMRERKDSGEFYPRTARGRVVLQARADGIVNFNNLRRGITPQTMLYTIIGINHTETRARHFHEALNSYFGWDQVHLAPVEVKDFEAAIEDLIHYSIRGVTVTLPFKEKAHSFIKKYGYFGDKESQISGAINTIINDEKGLIGWNTDIEGFLRASLEAGVNLKDINAAVIGCGGMGRAASTVLGCNKARSIRLFDIKATKAMLLESEFKANYPNTRVKTATSLEECLDRVEYVVQCSPVGMQIVTNPANCISTPVPFSLFKSSMSVIDAVYVPLETTFLRDAKNAGCQPIICGVKIAVYGGVKQIQHYLGEDVSPPLFPRMIEVGKQAILNTL